MVLPDFPTLGFLPQLYTLARAFVAYLAGLEPDTRVYVIKAAMEEKTKALRSFKADMEAEFTVGHVARSRTSKRIPSYSSRFVELAFL